MGVLKIEVDELVNTPPKSRKQVPEVQHMEYHEIKEHLTTEETIQEKLKSLKSDHNSKEQVDEMKETKEDGALDDWSALDEELEKALNEKKSRGRRR